MYQAGSGPLTPIAQDLGRDRWTASCHCQYAGRIHLTFPSFETQAAASEHDPSPMRWGEKRKIWRQDVKVNAVSVDIAGRDRSAEHGYVLSLAFFDLPED